MRRRGNNCAGFWSAFARFMLCRFRKWPVFAAASFGSRWPAGLICPVIWLLARMSRPERTARLTAAAWRRVSNCFCRRPSRVWPCRLAVGCALSNGDRFIGWRAVDRRPVIRHIWRLWCGFWTNVPERGGDEFCRIFCGRRQLSCVSFFRAARWGRFILAGFCRASERPAFIYRRRRCIVSFGPVDGCAGRLI